MRAPRPQIDPALVFQAKQIPPSSSFQARGNDGALEIAVVASGIH